MAVRIVSWAVADDMSVTPTSIQKAGVQGDDGATCVEFSVPTALQAGYDLYIELATAMGEYDKTDALPLVDGKISFLLPLAWTQGGGKAVLCLVAVEQTADGVEPATIHSEKARIIFSERHTGFARVQSLLKGSIHKMVDICEKSTTAIQKGVARIEELVENFSENIKDSIAKSCYRVIEKNKQVPMSLWIGTAEQYQAFKEKENNCISIVADDTLYQDLVYRITALQQTVNLTREEYLPLTGGTLSGTLFSQYGMPVLNAKHIGDVADFNELLPPGIYYLDYKAHKNSPNGKEINGILHVIGNYSSKYLLQVFYWFGGVNSIDIAPETYVRKIRGAEGGTVLFGKWNQIH